MAYQTAPNVVKVEMNALQNGIPVVNIHHVKYASAVTDTNLVEVSVAFSDWYEDHGRNLHHTSYVLQSIVATDLTVENGHQYSLSTFANPAGSVSGAAAAANAAAVISWRTANIGRSNRGRTYFGGLANANLTTAQTLDSTMTVALGLAAAALIDAIEDIGATLVVLSRFLNGVQRAVAVANAIISVIIDSKVDSQRRRTAN